MDIRRLQLNFEFLASNLITDWLRFIMWDGPNILSILYSLHFCSAISNVKEKEK